MQTRFSQFISRFAKDTLGGVALMGGLTFPVVFLAVGGSIDYTRAVSNQTKVQSAIDSTVLALTQKEPGTFDIQTEGEKIFRSFLTTGAVDVDVASVQFAMTGKIIEGTADVETRTFFLSVLGTPSMGGRAEASAIPPAQNPIEIALVLDVSGSMGNDLNGQSRIARMRTAVNEMFDTLDAELPAETKLSAALVPYSSSVNLSDYRDVLANTSLGGEALPTDEDVWVAERFVASNGVAYTLSEQAPNGNPIPFVVADEMRRAEPAARLAPLSENIDDVRASVNALTDNGWTAAHLGMVWGLYTLSPSWKDVWPDAPQEYGHADKIIVILSDGEFNTTYNIGDSVDLYTDPSAVLTEAQLTTQNDNRLEADAYFQDVCDLARERGITIYAVALNLDAASEAKLTTCAGTEGAVYPAATASELSNAFKNIASQLGERRLTM